MTSSTLRRDRKRPSLLRLVRRGVLPVRRSRLRFSSAMQQWMSRDENPFLTRALRCELRRHQPLLAVGITMSLIALANFLAWRFWLFVLGGDSSLRRNGYSFVRLPDVMGGNAIG
ncbi:MAG TPA: hypothetical protein VM821_01225, partial [Abditibacteriaceae bacterium]|nr:hypothetical protein [Abditibacteriaceae bacterium]